MIGTACEDVGVTKMDLDKANIVGCVCKTGSLCTKVWKSMTVDVLTTGTLTCPSGQVMQGISSGVPVCVSATSVSVSCPAGIQKLTSGVATCATPQVVN